ncbi:MAG: flagellar motor switch protein FliM [Clostridiales bacterium]|nr:flagellar motor switch protein FliM [Clostridiales bacterium]
MSDILTQAEIDELLNALATGSKEEAAPEKPKETGEYKLYDFRKALKFQKEQIRTLSIVFQTFGQLLANKLSGIMRTTCECEVLSVEEQSFNEFNNSLPIPVILSVLRLAPMRGSVLMEISPEAAYTLINRLLGGSVESEYGKQFTEIELALLQNVVKQILPIFEKAWEKVIKLTPQLERIETSPQFAQITGLSEASAIITLNLTVGGSSGLISVCIPHSSVEPIASSLNTLLLFSTSHEDDEKNLQHAEQLSDRLMHTPIALTAYFDETPATVRDIYNLQVGDVIRLTQKTQQPVLLKVQHIPKFYGQVGTIGRNYAIRVIDIIKGEEDDEL